MLKFYQKESELFPKEDNLILSDKETLMITKKLSRHFKFMINQVRFYGRGKNHSVAYEDGIRLNHNPYLLVLIHELSHVYNYQKIQWKKPYYKAHTKRLMHTMKKFIHYCRRKKYWNCGNAKDVISIGKFK